MMCRSVVAGVVGLAVAMPFVLGATTTVPEAPLVFQGVKGQGVYVNTPAGRAQTFACWFKVVGMGCGEKPYDRIVDGPDWYLHPVVSSNEVSMLVFGYPGSRGKLVSQGFSVSDGIGFGEWKHVAVTYSGEKAFYLYLNGVKITDAMGGSGVKRDLPKSLAGGLACIGNQSPGGDRPFKGEIVGVRMFDRCLSDGEILEMSAVDPDGNAVKRPKGNAPTPSDMLPMADISDDTARQVVIAEGAVDRYEGHPSTLVADDGKTLFCVWTTGHGGPCGQMARSDDGGKTWRRVDGILPPTYARTHRNCPIMQKIHGADGVVRYFIHSHKAQEGSGLGIVMSEDLGETWTELPCQTQLSAGMPPTGMMELKNGTVAIFGQVFKDRNRSKDRPDDDQAVWMAVSQDGGKTYGEMRIVMMSERRNLCEPCCLRSPDGNSLVLLARENRHCGRSMMCFSHDEGQSWSEPVDTPWALTGDRHEGVLLPDGRYVIAFRDQGILSPTRGQFVAWVGTFDDLANGRNGQYRIHLQHHHGLGAVFPGGDWDTGYSGVELLADGTLVCTTYSRHFDDDRQSSVVAARFRIADTDAMVK